MRINRFERNTKETQIAIEVNLDGCGKLIGKTEISFFDHMIDLFTKHSNFDLEIEVVGDLDIDSHHTVEDFGITLGNAIRNALGDKRGIKRYGSIILPMDEALILCAIDLSNRAYLDFECELNYDRIGNFETELVIEFLQAFTNALRCNLHIVKLKGDNTHHIIEGVFKGLARALREAVSFDGTKSLPSTKGSL